jgi:hypothetical protein
VCVSQVVECLPSTCKTLSSKPSNTRKKKKGEVGMVAYTCNPRCLVGGDWEDCGLRPAWAKKINKTPSQQINQAWWHGSDPSYTGGVGRSTMVGGTLGWPRTKNMGPYLKNN